MKNELRIGNYVSLHGILITMRDSDFNFDESYFKPITLTEEWLLKFGFVRHHADYANDVIYIKNILDNTEFEWGVYPNTLGSGIQIQNRNLLKYVHQLQNLYFALTNKELTI